MKIVCGTDFSAPAAGACQLAAHLARRLGDSLLLVHAAEPFSVYGTEKDSAAMFPPSSLGVEYRKRAEAEIGALAGSLRGLGVAVETQVAEGHAEDVLVAAASACGARLIVAGRHGRRTLGRLFVGSTAERLVDRADRPVLVVGAMESAPRWAATSEPLRLAVAVDDSGASDTVIERTAELARQLASVTTFLQVYYPPSEASRLGLQPLALPTERAHVAADLEGHLRRRVAGVAGGAQAVIRIEPSWSRAGAALAELAEEVDADLVIAGTHQWNRLERLQHYSVSHDLLREARVPVLLIPSALGRPARQEPLPVLRRVLVPTDLSESADRALLHAYGLAQEVLGTVEVLHVVEDGGPHPARPLGRRGALLSEEERARLEASLRAKAPKEVGEGVGTRITIIEGGRPGEVIRQVAERYDVDAICLATHGKGGWRERFFGSVAQEVVERSTRPILLVRGRRP